MLQQGALVATSGMEIPDPAAATSGRPLHGMNGSPFQAEIERDRKLLLLKSVRSTTAPTIGAAGLVTTTFWSSIDHAVLIVWALLTIAVGLFRLMVVRKVNTAGIGGDPADWGHRYTMLGTALASLMWVAGLPLFYSDSITDMMVPAFLYVILCCGGTTSLSVYRRAFLVFVPPVMLGVVSIFVLHAVRSADGRVNAMTIAIALILMIAVLFRLMRQTDEQLTQSLLLNYQNGMLVGDLKTAKERTEEEKSRQVRRREDLERLTKSFEAKVSGLMTEAGRASVELIASADDTNRLVRDTLAQASQVTTSARDVAERIQTVSAAAQQLSSSIGLVNQDVVAAAGIAQQSVTELARTNDIVQSLAEASQRVGEIVGMITLIAKQTNMLALNATIEAQRAGEAGRGFAVVAGEVKNLASQTGRATCEITEHIARIQSRTANAMEAISSIGKTVLKVNGIAERVVVSVREQGDTTTSISLDLHRVAGDTALVTDAVVKLDESASLAVGATEKTATLAGALTQSSRETMGQIREFLVGVQQQG